MNEPTNKPSRPIVVGFGSVPGGTGCTTLAIHAATYAARQGLHTLAISIDPSADMLRRLGCDEACIDGHRTKEKRLKLAFVPPETYLFSVVEYLPNLGFGGEVGNPEIIILDLGPGLITPPLLVRADFWVVPIQDSRSLASIEQRRFPMGITETLFVLSRVPLDASRRLLESTRDCLKTVNREKARLLNSIVPSSGLLRRTASERKTIWELTSRSLTTRKVEGFCREVVENVLGKKRTQDAHVRTGVADAIGEAEDDIARAFASCARGDDGASLPRPGVIVRPPRRNAKGTLWKRLGLIQPDGAPDDEGSAIPFWIRDDAETLKAAQELNGIARVENDPPDAAPSAADQRPTVIATARPAHSATRRAFSDEFKRSIVEQAAACSKPGEIRELLRTHGLYSSHLTDWRRSMARADHRVSGLAHRIKQSFEREKERLRDSNPGRRSKKGGT
ncbi:MAG: transposase [Myxococcales bacterium]|nr:transposase [Myxococcales bacterium]